MEVIIKEFNQWLKDNQNFILHLRSHDSSLYTRLSPIYEVLNFIAEEIVDHGLELNDDLYKIFQIGLEYLHSQVQTCKLYLENNFKNNFHDFMHYDNVIGYLLYIEDLRYELQDNEVNFDNQVMDKLVNHLEEILDKAEGTPENLNLLVDSEVHKIVDPTKFDFKSIIDIFIEIAETLGIELYIESDFVIGKDI